MDWNLLIINKTNNKEYVVTNHDSHYKVSFNVDAEELLKIKVKFAPGGTFSGSYCDVEIYNFEDYTNRHNSEKLPISRFCFKKGYSIDVCGLSFKTVKKKDCKTKECWDLAIFNCKDSKKLVVTNHWYLYRATFNVCGKERYKLKVNVYPGDGLHGSHCNVKIYKRENKGLKKGVFRKTVGCFDMKQGYSCPKKEMGLLFKAIDKTNI